MNGIANGNLKWAQPSTRPVNRKQKLELIVGSRHIQESVKVYLGHAVGWTREYTNNKSETGPENGKHRQSVRHWVASTTWTFIVIASLALIVSAHMQKKTPNRMLRLPRLNIN